MNDYSALYQGLLDYWNSFASANGYEQLPKTNDKIRRILRRRMRAERDFLERIPYYFSIIQKHCGGKDEFGQPLTLHSVLRSTTSLRALRAELGV